LPTDAVHQAISYVTVAGKQVQLRVGSSCARDQHSSGYFRGTECYVSQKEAKKIQVAAFCGPKISTATLKPLDSAARQEHWNLKLSNPLLHDNLHILGYISLAKFFCFCDIYKN
jgi:hypothetical protein